MAARTPLRRWWLAGLLLLIFLLPAVPAAADTLLVVPFENTARAPDLEWLGESYAEALSVRLSGDGHRVATREERLAALERLSLPPTAPLTWASLLRLGEEVGADWVVVGRFSIEGVELRSQAQLLGVRSLRLSPWVEVAGPLARLLELQGQLAWQLLRWLDPTYPYSRNDFLEHFPRLSTSAFESYVRGLLAMNREQQRRYFLQANHLEPGYAAPIFRVGQMALEDMDYATAARWFAKIPWEDSLALEARFNLSLCQFFLGEFARATQTLAPLAESAPQTAVWNNLGVFASRGGDDEPAVGYFQRGLEREPANADLYFNLALHYLRRSQWPAAARILGRSVELSPGDKLAWQLLASAQERAGHKAEAERAREQASVPEASLELERDALEFDRLSQEFSPRARRDAPSAAGSSQAATGHADHADIHAARGEDLLARGALEEARQELTEAVLLDPASSRAHFLLAEVFRRLGFPCDAIAELKASIWGQDTVAARLALAEIYLEENRAEEARAEVRAALALDPANQAARAPDARLGGRRTEEGRGE